MSAKDPQKLFVEGASDFEREMLRSWAGEQPSDAARARVLAAVGLGAAATIAGAGAATKLGAAAGGSIAPKAAAAALGMTAAKWIAVGAVGIAITGATVGYVRHERATRAATANATPTPTPTAIPTPTLAQTANATPTPTLALTPTPTAPPAKPSRPSSSPAPASTLGEQVTALDAARRSLSSGDTAGALRQLDDYGARFPDGALRDEAEVLRIEALVASGDHTAAARVGARFLAAHPKSPHAARVRALIGP